MYLFAFGREAEAEGAAAEKAGVPLPRLIAQFLESGEFADRVIEPVLRGDFVDLELKAVNEAPVLASWAAERLPLEEDTRDRLLGSGNWYQLLAVVLDDPTFRRASGAGDAPWGSPELSEALLERAAAADRILVAEITGCDIWSVRGRLAAPRWSGPPPLVEVHADGSFVGAAPSLEIVSRSAGPEDERREFSFQVEYDLSGAEHPRPARLELREPSSGQVFAKAVVQRGGDLEGLTSLRDMLQVLQCQVASLDRTFRSMPALQSLPLSAWSEYWNRYYGGETLCDVGGPSLDIIVATEAAPWQTPALERLLGSLRADDLQSWRLILGIDHRGSDERLEELADRHARHGGRIEWARADAETPGARLGAAMAQARSEHVLLLGSGVVLADSALRILRGVLRTRRPPLVYWDHDHIEEDALGRERHREPHLKPACDPALLRQVDYIGPTVLVSQAAVQAAGGLRDEPDAVRALTRRIVSASPTEIVHLPRVLHHVRSPRAYGDEASSNATQRIPPVAIAADTTSAHSLPEGVRAAVIIPTRDRVELLKPCVDSVLRTGETSRVGLQLCVVDNRSREAATADYLTELSRHPTVRTLTYSGPFNWAALNNWTAAQVDAEVLVFLNNDTVVIAPDWLDALCEQAMRPEVGAVGGRLLFADGTLQHAGMVLTPAGAAHEGLGRRADEDGYLGRYNLVRRAAAVTGACLATRRDVFAAVGGFDDLNFPITFNDVDYCMKVRRKGMDVIYAPGCTLYHFEGKTRGSDAADAEKIARHRREQATYTRKWGAASFEDPFYNAHFDRSYPPFTRLTAPPSAADLFDSADRA